MIIHTKKKFQDTQHEIDACRRRRFELDTFTDELTHSFSQSLSISSSNQCLQQQCISDIRNEEKSQAKITAKSIHFESKTIRTSDPVSGGGCEHEIQVINSSQIPNSLTYNVGVLLQTSSTQRMERKSLSVKGKTNPKKKPSNVSHTSIILDAGRHSPSREKYLQLVTVMDNTPLPSDFLNLAPAQDLVVASDSTADCSRKTLAIEENPSTRQASKNLEETTNHQMTLQISLAFLLTTMACHYWKKKWSVSLTELWKVRTTCSLLENRIVHHNRCSLEARTVHPL